MIVTRDAVGEVSSVADEVIRFGKAAFGDFQAASSREWLETNGLGGYASSTIIGTNTRRYHGLLVAAAGPSLARMVILSNLEETLILKDGSRYNLSCNNYPGGIIHPEGYKDLEEFRIDPFPVFTYKAGDVTIEKAVFMVHGENTTVVTYKILRSPGYLELVLQPLIAIASPEPPIP